jgi:RNA polymerase sigma-70 factor (ECF subfamily)
MSVRSVLLGEGSNQVSHGTESIPTRQSLLSRLKDWKDQESWRVFFDTYWKLIYHTGIRAGLTDSEAQDLVQETLLSVLKGVSRSQYDSKKGSFKNWLMRLTGWRIADQLRRRDRRLESARGRVGTSTETATLEHVADPAGLKLEILWEEEWQENLMEAAIHRIKKKVDPKHYQAFDLYVYRKWPVSKVSSTLEISPGKVYLIKHRIQRLIAKEISCLQARGM